MTQRAREWLYPPSDKELNDLITAIYSEWADADDDELIANVALKHLGDRVTDPERMAYLIWYIGTGVISVAATMLPVNKKLEIPEDVFSSIRRAMPTSEMRRCFTLIRQSKYDVLMERVALLTRYELAEVVGAMIVMALQLIERAPFHHHDLVQRAAGLRMAAVLALNRIQILNWCGDCLLHAMEVQEALNDLYRTAPMDDRIEFVREKEDGPQQ